MVINIFKSMYIFIYQFKWIKKNWISRRNEKTADNIKILNVLIRKISRGHTKRKEEDTFGVLLG